MGKYVERLLRLSIKYFQKELFTLQLYNIIMNQWILRSATFRLRNKTTVDKLATNLSEKDIRDVLKRKKKNQSSFTGSFPYSPATQFVSAIDAITAYLPHTNATARKKHNIVECLQHHFGIPTFFLTISPDDENSWIIQVLCGEQIDHNICFDSDDNLRQKVKECIALRIEFPGMCALFFEEVLQVIVKEFISWDGKNEAPREGYEGLLGVPTAFSMSNEEQARCTLHVHILLWVKNLNELLEKLLSAATTLCEKANVRKLLIKKFDEIASCKLVDFGGKQSLKVQQCFDL